MADVEDLPAGLVLSRQREEKLVIGNSTNLEDNIVITIVDIRGDKVRVGIKADPSIGIHRLEVWRRIQAEIKAGHTPSLKSAMNMVDGKSPPTSPPAAPPK